VAAGPAIGQAQFLPELPGSQHRAVLAAGIDAEVAETNAAQALGRGELAQVADEGVDLVRRELIATTQGAQDGALDTALNAVVLDDIDVLVDVAILDAATDLDEHGRAHDRKVGDERQPHKKSPLHFFNSQGPNRRPF